MMNASIQIRLFVFITFFNLVYKVTFSERDFDWMDGYFVYRRSTLKGHIASNKFCYMKILFNEKFKNIKD